MVLKDGKIIAENFVMSCFNCAFHIHELDYYRCKMCKREGIEDCWISQEKFECRKCVKFDSVECVFCVAGDEFALADEDDWEDVENV